MPEWSSATRIRIGSGLVDKSQVSIILATLQAYPKIDLHQNFMLFCPSLFDSSQNDLRRHAKYL